MRGVNKAGSGQHGNPKLPGLKNPTGRDHNKEDRRSMRMKMTRAAAAGVVVVGGLLTGCGIGAAPPEPSPGDPVQVTAAESQYPQSMREYWADEMTLEDRQNFCQVWTESLGGPETIRDGWFADQWALPEEDQRINLLMWDAFMDILNEECR